MNLIDRLQGWLTHLTVLRPARHSAGKLNDSEQQAHLQQLASDRPADRWLAAEALGVSNLTASARHALQASLSHADPILRWEAAAALARGGSAPARIALFEALATGDPAVQSAAADALGLSPAEPEILAALAAALASRHPAVRQSAAEALARLAAQPRDEDALAPGLESVPALLGLLESDPAPMVRRAAALALGRIGDSSAREPLAARQADSREESMVRTAAAVALTRLRVPAPEPEAPAPSADDPAASASAGAGLSDEIDPD